MSKLKTMIKMVGRAYCCSQRCFKIKNNRTDVKPALTAKKKVKGEIRELDKVSKLCLWCQIQNMNHCSKAVRLHYCWHHRGLCSGSKIPFSSCQQ